MLIQAGASERRREGFSLATMDFTQVGVSERRRRRPNKGRKCPTVEQIKAKMGEGMEGEHVKVEENFFNVEQWQYRENIKTKLTDACLFILVFVCLFLLSKQVTGASSPSWAGSTRTETRRTRQLLLT